MTTAVYVLCALTSIACAALLLRAFIRTRARLLFWASVCFVGLSLNNIFLCADKVVAPDVDLSLSRSIPALIGVMAFVYGLVWHEGER